MTELIEHNNIPDSNISSLNYDYVTTLLIVDTLVTYILVDPVTFL